MNPKSLMTTLITRVNLQGSRTMPQTVRHLHLLQFLMKKTTLSFLLFIVIVVIEEQLNKKCPKIV